MIRNNNFTFLFVHTVVFLCGSVLMALEISGSRVLAPHFGNSIFVWASLISVLLVALACGYYWGGRLADKMPSLGLWGIIIGFAGISILSVPLLSGPVCRFIAHLSLGDRAGVLMATGCLFFLPSLLLGTASPFAIKFNLSHISRAGNVAGKLYAVSTMGNVFGTLFTAFYLIARFDIFTIFMTLGLILIITAASILVFVRKRKYCIFSILLLFASVVMLSTPSPALVSFENYKKVILEKDSFYQHIIVVDDPTKRLRSLHFDQSEQTAIRLYGRHWSSYDYIKMFHLPLLFAPESHNALFIGAGGAVAPREYSDNYPDLKIDIVEVDPAVAQISQNYFFLKPNRRLRMITDDARRYIQKTTKKYDIVVHDAYLTKNQIPFHLLTREFFSELSDKMGPKGVMALNLGGAVTGKRSALFLAVHKTLSAVFKHVYVFPDISGETLVDYRVPRNLILIATKSGDKYSSEQLLQKIDSLTGTRRIRVPSFTLHAQNLIDVSPYALSKAILLTDHYAPVEYLSQH